MPLTFQQRVRRELAEIEALLVRKNEAYGNSALDPVRVFSRASPDEQLRVRIDDKLSRLARGANAPDEDTIADLIGYLILLRVSSAPPCRLCADTQQIRSMVGGVVVDVSDCPACNADIAAAEKPCGQT